MAKNKKYGWSIVSESRGVLLFGGAETVPDAINQALDLWDGIPAGDYRIKVSNFQSGILLDEKRLVQTVENEKFSCRWEPV